MNYIDRNNIAAAKLAHLERDLGLVGTEYQTSVSILFVGYELFARQYIGTILIEAK